MMQMATTATNTTLMVATTTMMTMACIVGTIRTLTNRTIRNTVDLMDTTIMMELMIPTTTMIHHTMAMIHHTMATIRTTITIVMAIMIRTSLPTIQTKTSNGAITGSSGTGPAQ